MTVEIVQVGDLVLRQVARRMTREELAFEATHELIDRMRDTMRAAPGVGLAAPQIGVPLQLAVIEDRAEYLKDVSPEVLAERERRPVPFLVLVNPRIVEHSEEQAEFFEGCLSLAGYSALVKRSRSVTVEYWDKSGEPRRLQAKGWFARILQHEIDHLNGWMYIDRMEPRSFMNLENLGRHWKELPIGKVREALGLGE